MSIDPQSFKQAMAHFASGVTVVTTELDGERYGMTVAAFASVSVDPPLVLVCLSNKASACGPVLRAQKFAVNILAADQLRIGAQFAGMIKDVSHRFEGVAADVAVTGAPLLVGSLASVDCLVRQAHPAGDHTVFIGEVVATRVREGADALLFFNRNWRVLADEPLSLE